MTNTPKNAYLRTKNRKYPQIILTMPDGSTRSFSVKSDLKTAEEVLETVRRKIALKTFNIDEYVQSPKSKMTLEDFNLIYLKHRAREASLGRLSEMTIALDRHAWSLFIEKIGGKTRLIDISEATINKFIDILLNSETRLGNPYKHTSINSYLRHLGSAFSFAKERKLIDHNPFRDVKKIPVNKTIRVLTKEEIQRLRDYFSERIPWQLDALNLALWTGCRLESVIKIKAKDLIWEQLDGRKEPFLRLVEKGNKERFIPLLEEPLELIQKRIRILHDGKTQEEMLRGSPKLSNEKIYRKRIKEGYLFWEISVKYTVSKSFTRAKQALGIKNATFHSLRKSFATYALEQGLSLEVVQQILGHADFRTTQKLYAKVTLKKLNQEIKRIKPV
jgi:site-specific recombinase XerD